MKKFNQRLGLWITEHVGTMACAYFFLLLALVSLPSAIATHNIITIDFWVCQNFLQLVLLAIILFGQKEQGKTSEARSIETHDTVMREFDLIKQELQIMKEERALIKQELEILKK